jgi:hypothetical protein
MMNSSRKFQWLILFAIAWPVAWALSAQSPPNQTSANELARYVIRNEAELGSRDQSLWTYRQLQEKDGIKKSFQVYETKDGEIDRLMAVDGQPLPPEQRATEDRRIAKLTADPSAMREEMRKQRHDAEQAAILMNILPDAFLFRYAGTQGDLVKLAFTPNPNFHPSGHPAQVFHDMAGRMLVDDKQMRLAEIDGQLSDEVKFGGGIFGHLDKGGTFSVKLRDVGSGHWEMILMNVQMNGKVLFFKTIAVREKESYDNFQPLPDGTTARQANDLMIKGPATLNVSRR